MLIYKTKNGARDLVNIPGIVVKDRCAYISQQIADVIRLDDDNEKIKTKSKPATITRENMVVTCRNYIRIRNYCRMSEMRHGLRMQIQSSPVIRTLSGLTEK